MPEISTDLDLAVHYLKDGALVALPTETVYGVAGDATNDKAVANIFALKKRPEFNPLIIHYPHITFMNQDVEITELAKKLANAFWPGPLTLVLPRRQESKISFLASAGLDTLAVRIPSHPMTLQILRNFGKPVAAPSANPSSKVSPTSAQHVFDSFKNNPLLPLIIDGGACHVGIESTIIDLTVPIPKLLRPGKITAEEIKNLTGIVLENQSHSKSNPKAPGQLKIHYAPHIPLYLNCTAPKKDQALLAFGPHIPKGAAYSLNLSPSGNLNEAATNLFAMIRLLDNDRYASIAVMPIPKEGLGHAINDRLKRAAQE